MRTANLLPLAAASCLFASAVSLAATPTATTTGATAITNSSAQLNGTGNPNSEAATGWFRYDTVSPGTCNDTFGTRVPVAGGTDLGTGSIAVPYGINVTGLVSGTTYYYCALVNNASGTAFGGILSFVIPGAPITLTVGATSVTTTTAVLNGSANPVAAATNGYFRYSTTDPGTCNDTFGTRAPSSGGSSLGSGTTSVDYLRSIAGLFPGNTYYFCAIAQNTYGTTFGAVLNFTTPALAPSATTNSATAITASGFTLNGSAIPNGDSTTGWFRYSATFQASCNDTFGTRVPVSGGTALGSGNSWLGFSEPVTGALPGTTYYFCAIAQNSLGTAFGGVLAVTTLAVPPVVTTLAATGLTGFSAMLNGSANPGGGSTSGYYRYSTTDPGTCNDTFGTRAPTSGGWSLGSGTSPVSYNQLVSGLTPTTTYYFCAIAQNGMGTGFGTVLTFTTPAAAPTVTTSPATSVGGSGATLNGTANPNGDATTGWYRYSTTSPGTCNDTFGARVPAAGGTPLGAGLTAVAFSEPLTGLSMGTTYYFCAIAQNGVGTSVGTVRSFTTFAPPTVTTSAPSSVWNTTATLAGTVNPNLDLTTGWFRYDTVNPGACDDTFGTRAPTTGGNNMGSGGSALNMFQSLTGLTPKTTYFYCAIAQNNEGLSFGMVVSFTTYDRPTVATLAATSVLSSSATLNGSVNPNGLSTTSYFRYSTTSPGTCNDTFGSMTSFSSLGSGWSTVFPSNNVGGLSPGTTYYFCAIATNGVGTSLGALLSFTTQPTLPQASTGGVTTLTNVSATLSGSGIPGGDSATGYFRYSTTHPGTCNDIFGTRVPGSGGSALGSGNTWVAYSQLAASLSPLTTYYYCAIAQNSVGTGFGAVGSFTTADAPTVTTGGVSAVTSNSANLLGSGNPNNASTTGWFRISATNPGTCDDVFGTRVPGAGGSAMGSGSTVTSFGQSISGLSPGTTYYYCAIDSNAYGTAFGAIASFNTAGPPTVTTNAATSVVWNSAVLNGSANPNQGATSGWFRYATTNPGTCNDTFGTRTPGSGGVGLGSGTSPVSYSQSTFTLTPTTTYYYCAIASNSYGTSFGSVMTLTTPAGAPQVTTNAATVTDAVSATLNGNANPEGDPTTGWFRYSTSNPGSCSDLFGTRVPATGGTSLGSGLAGVAYSEPVTGLTTGATYYYCAIAQNAIGTSLGNLQTFVPAGAPIVTTQAATAITSSTATLNSIVNPNGASTTGYYRYGTTDPGTCNTSWGSMSSSSGLGAGASGVSNPISISSLAPATTYYFCAAGSNAKGLTLGTVLSFTTLPNPPTAVTGTVSGLTSTSATLQGQGQTGSATTTGWFRYSTTNPGTCNNTFGTATAGTNLGSGLGWIGFSDPISGLASNTTYYYCAIAQNSVGTAFGNVFNFTTPAAPEATTTAATSITGTSALLNGTGDPNGATTAGWFRISTTDPGTCDDTFGLATSPTSNLSSGMSPTAYFFSINTLSPGTTYYYCAIVSNVYGMAFGSVLSFTTANVPTVTTLAATGITSSTGTLQGTAVPNGMATNGSFRYATTDPGSCNGTFGTATLPTSLGAGTSSVPFSSALTGLLPGTTYYYCAIASNGVGTTYGAVLNFATPALVPTVTTTSSSGVTNTNATLNGSANPRGANTTGYFRYDTTSPGACNDTFGTRAPASGGSILGAGNSVVSFSQALTGLTPATTYYFCAIGQNSVGTSFGALLSFTTLAAPSVSTLAATPVTATTATLNGMVTPNGSATTGWFRYANSDPGACSDSFGTRVPTTGGTGVGSGWSPAGYQQSISGLSPATTYWFCAIASNSIGTSLGAVFTFTTSTAPPSVIALPASGMTGTTATLNGSGNANGSSTTAWFRYSTTNPGTCNDAFGTRVPSSGGSDLGAGNTVVSYSQPVSGLSAGTTYYVCTLASSGVGNSVSSVISFTTATPPAVTTAAASGIGGTAATLNGSANPNQAATTGWFRYDTSSPGVCNDTFGTRAPATGGSSLGAGGTSVAYNLAISGLANATTYYFCAIAQNSEGTSFGSVLSFTTASAPVVTTSAATSVGSTTATLNGSGTPNLAATTGWFRYSTSDPGTCDDTFGTRAPASGGASLGSGSSAVAFSQAVTGLSAGTTYYFCAIAQNSVAISFGSVLTFTTLAAPTVTTSAPSPVASTSATLNGSANPNLAATTGWFRYATTSPGTCNDTFGTRAPAAGGASLGSGNTAAPYTQPISGLAAATTYYVCAIASNSVGTSFGSVVAFTTTATPVVTTSAASAVASTTTTLNGSANPRLDTTTGWFRYSTTSPGTCNDTFGSRVPAAGGTNLGAGSSAVAYAEPLTGLAAATTYYYCAIAQNSVGTSLGLVLSFTTTAVPVVTTSPATGVIDTVATLNGSANPRLDATTGWFRYDTTTPGACNDTFGTRAPATGGTSLGSGSSAVSYSDALSGLNAGTTYYFCAIAQNAVGTSFGSIQSFTTIAAPVVTTSAATAVGSSSATLNGTANPRLDSTTGWFRYSSTDPGTCNDTFGTRAPAASGTSLGAGNTAAPYSQVVTGLSAGTTYYVCAIASNSAGKSFGLPVPFTTTAAPFVTTSAPTPVASTSATLNGTANPNLATTTGWFRYATTNPGTCNDTFGTRAPATGGTGLGSGSSALPYSQAISGLTAATVYYVCAIASNSVGTSFGSPVSFTTTATPLVTTSAPNPVASTTATLNALATPRLDATTGWFRYNTTSPGTCNDTFGTRVPAAGGTNLGAGSSAVAYSEPLTGLLAGTTYYFCAIAQNSVGTSFGSVLSFTTTAVPVVTTSAASGVAATAATLNGSANPRLDATTGWFRFDTTNPGACNDTFGTRVPAAGGTNLGSGSIAVAYSQALTALPSGTTYYFCAIASNSVGTSVGSVLSFTTQAAPTVTTSAATLVTNSTATLNGSANPNLAATTAWFRYSTTSPGTCNDTFGFRAPTTGGTNLGSGSTAAAYSQALSGLSAGTTYYVCAIASNSVGMSFGVPVPFTTTAAPSVTTSVPSPVASTSATLNGTANPNLASATGWFRYSTTNPGICNDAFGVRLPATGGSPLGSGGTAVAFSQAATGLAAATTYYVCAIASNSVGTSFGNPVAFTTTATPVVTTSAATSVGSNSAILNGSANPRLDAATGWFRYSTTSPGTCNDTFGTRVPTTGGSNLGAGSTAVAYSQTATSLAAGTTYYFCAIAQNSVGTTLGSVLSFTTTAAPVVATSAATGVTDTVATLNGSANPMLDTTTGYFRYSTTSPGTCNDAFGTRAPATGGTSLGSGSTSAPYSQLLSGLTAGTTYYFCAIAQNSVSTSFGSVLSFTMQAAPTVATSAVTGVGGTTATLNGLANPNLASTTGYFRYSTTNPVTCNDVFGTRAPTTGGSLLGSGGGAVAYSQAITGLTAGTTYYACAIASNSVGTSFGSPVSFTTPAAPTVTTVAASSISSTFAQLNGTANPNLGSTTGWFRYSPTNPGTCNDTFGTRSPPSGGTGLGSGSSASPYGNMITGLAAGTTYYYCAIAQNLVGTSFGSVLSFTTIAAPVMLTSPAAPVASTTATLNGSANPMLASTLAWFRYSATSPGTCNDTFGTRVPSTGGSNVGAGGTAVAYSQPATGLAPATTYYYCAIAMNSVGTSFGSVLSFTTTAVPVVSTSTATSVLSTTVTLNGSANPMLDATTGYFRYSAIDPGTCNDVFGTRAPAAGGTSLGSGGSAVAYSQALTGLTAGTPYYFCALGQNSVGTSVGSVMSFTTTAAPAVSTSAASSVMSTTATLNGAANPMLDSTSGYFRYSATNPGACNDTFGTRAPTVGGSNLGSGGSSVVYSQAVTGLAAGTTYFYCAIAQNSVGTSFGSVLSFTTTAAPVVSTSAATLVLSTTASLNGSANPMLDATTGYFRYSATDPGTCNDTFGTRAPGAGGASLGTGSAAAAYSQALASLAPATTYYFCAIAQNSVGTSFGAVFTFTTTAAPLASTSAATSVGSGSATLNGSATPRLDTATGYFRYSTTNPGTCNDTFGTRAPTAGGTGLGAGSTPVSYSQVVTGLVAGTAYYFCAIAQNSVGTAFGSVLSFTTTAAPATTTFAATGVASVAATLNGAANPMLDATTGYFRYSATDPGACNDTFGTRAPVAGGTSLGSGSSSVPYSDTLSGLTPGTTYYFCAIAQNSVGTSVGSVMSFTTTATPFVQTTPASPVSSTAATLNGNGNPSLLASTGWFRYDTTDPGACNDTFGTRAPAVGGTSLGSGSTGVPFSQAISGLTPKTTYYYCAMAQNSVGLGTGAVLSFTTPAVPTVTTTPATAVATTSATLNGLANPNLADTTGYFRFGTANPGVCDDTFGTRAPATGGAALGTGSTAQTYAQALTGLVPGTTYYFCAAAQNAVGTSFGTVLSFNTPALPVVTTSAVTSLTSTSATLNGAANPKWLATSGWFRYSSTDPGACSDTFGTRAPSTGGTSLGSQGSTVSYFENLTGLAPGTTFYYCAIAANSLGTSFGPLMTFTTPNVPGVTTSPATGVTSTSATLQASVIPNFDPTTAWFRYSSVDPGACDDTFGTRAPGAGGTDMGSGGSAVPHSYALTGLSPGTTYYFCAIAQNSVGTTLGTVLSFTTTAAPVAATSAATSVSSTAATLNGAANPRLDATVGWFRYSTSSPGTCNDVFGTRTPVLGGTSLGAGSTPVPYSQSVTGLQPGTTYYFCAISQNLVGTSYGTVLTFTTTAAPQVTTSAATSVASTIATLNGSAIPRLDPTVGWFRYSATDPGTCNDTFGTRAPTSSGSDLGSGSSAVPYSQSLTGLTPGTTYYYCAIAQNSVDVSLGAVLSFTTLAAPSVTTIAASLVGGTTATLNGSANPNLAATGGWFRYSSTDPGACDDLFGTRAPSASGSVLGSGNTPVSFFHAVTGLTPDTTYYFCAIAQNSVGTSMGSVLSFHTPTVPTVTTGSATNVTGTGAILPGLANPNRDATTAWFRVSPTDPGTCNDTFGTRAPTTGGTSLGAGSTPSGFSEVVTGLSPATQYYYCAIAANGQGTSFGSVLTFTTLVLPAVTTVDASGVTDVVATLHGTASPNGNATTGWFRYDTTAPGNCNDTFGTRAPASLGTPLGLSGTDLPFSQALTALVPGTTYYFCAIASSFAGTAFGQVQSFTTLGPPVVATLPPTSVTRTSAMLNGSANPKLVAATGYFRFDVANPGSCNDTFGTRAPASGGTSLGAGGTPKSFSEVVSGLTPGATYYVCAIASNALGTSFGSPITFTTGVLPPDVETQAATDITSTSATLAGAANPKGQSTGGWFRYSTTEAKTCDDSFGTRVPTTDSLPLGEGTSPSAYSVALTGLTASTTYYYCAAASSQGGAAFGAVLSFTTPAPTPTVTTLSGTATADSAVLSGSANPNGIASTGWFRYATTQPETCDDSFGTRAPAADGVALGDGSAAVPYTQTVTGLGPGNYYFCALASNASGTSFGELVMFQVPLIPQEPIACGCGTGSGARWPAAWVAGLFWVAISLRRRRR